MSFTDWERAGLVGLRLPPAAPGDGVLDRAVGAGGVPPPPGLTLQPIPVNQLPNAADQGLFA